MFVNICEDGHNKQETPVPISNTEVKLLMLQVVLASAGKPVNCPHFFRMRKKPDKVILNNIKKLFAFAKKESKKRPWLAKRYVILARKMAKRNNISLKKYRRKFCHKCNAYFVPGKNCKIRLSKGKISIKCLECGNYARYIYKR